MCICFRLGVSKVKMNVEMLPKLKRTDDQIIEMAEPETVSDVEREEDIIEFLDRMLMEEKIRNQKKSSKEPNKKNKD